MRANGFCGVVRAPSQITGSSLCRVSTQQTSRLMASSPTELMPVLAVQVREDRNISVGAKTRLKMIPRSE
jgi:hypothetical protein